jgi:hypothetical protein
MNLLRRLRGVGSTTAVWAVGWTAIAWPVFIALLPRLAMGPRLLAALRMASYAGLAGAATGAAFAVLLTALERRATLASLRSYRVAIWGAAAGAAYGVGIILRGPAGAHESVGVIAAAGAVGAVLGGASGLLTLLLAREGSRPRSVIEAARRTERVWRAGPVAP